MNISSTHNENRDSALEYVWEQYRIFAATSRDYKSRLFSWRLRVLILSIVGAAFGVLCQQSTGWGLEGGGWQWLPRILGIISAIAIGLATFFGREMLKSERERNWIRSRSLAEEFKSQSYIFAANASPYDATGACDVLLKKTEELLELAKGLTTSSIKDSEKRRGLPPDRLSIDQYIQVRVDDQINFYRSRAAEHEKTVSLWRNVSLYFGCIAVLLGALGFTGWTAGWVGVISSITASIAAYLYSGRYQYLVISYQATARRLELLRTRWLSSGKTDADSDERNLFISECEEAISVENNAWMAEFAKP